MKPELLTELFVRADSEELGIAIETNNPASLVADLHQHRTAVGLWPNIMIVTPSTPNTVFLTQRSVELD